VLSVVAVVVALIAWRLGSDDAADDQPDSPTSSQSSQSSQSSPEPSATPTADAVTADGMENFVGDYLTTVTSDPKAAWGQLTPEFQAQSGGFGQYKRFWSDFKSADVLSAEADPQTLTISYRVEYLHQDGSRTTDDVTLQLEGTDGDYLIAGES